MKPCALGIYYYQGLFYISLVNQKLEFVQETTKNLSLYQKKFSKLTWISTIDYLSCIKIEVKLKQYHQKSKAWWRNYLDSIGYEVVYFDIFYQGFDGLFYSWIVYWVPPEQFEIYLQDRSISLQIIDIDLFCLWNYFNHFYPSQFIREVLFFDSSIYGRGSNIWGINVKPVLDLQESIQINSPWIMSKSTALRGVLYAL